MRKILLFGLLITFALQTFSFSMVMERSSSSYVVPGKLNTKNFLDLTPKRYMELTGRRMSIKQRIAFVILNQKLKRQIIENKTINNRSDLGLLSLIVGASAFVTVLIPFINLLSLPLAITAIVLGIIGLGRKRGDTKSIIGLVLGSLFLFALIGIIGAMLTGGWE